MAIHIPDSNKLHQSDEATAVKARASLSSRYEGKTTGSSQVGKNGKTRSTESGNALKKSATRKKLVNAGDPGLNNYTGCFINIRKDRIAIADIIKKNIPLLKMNENMSQDIADCIIAHLLGAI